MTKAQIDQNRSCLCCSGPSTTNFRDYSKRCNGRNEFAGNFLQNGPPNRKPAITLPLEGYVDSNSTGKSTIQQAFDSLPGVLYLERFRIRFRQHTRSHGHELPRRRLPPGCPPYGTDAVDSPYGHRDHPPAGARDGRRSTCCSISTAR